MEVDPRGLPAAMKAWREREPQPALTLRCGAPGCDADVGAVYQTPQGPVVESWLTAPEQAHDPYAPASADLAAFADNLGVVGLLDDVPASTGAGDDEPAGAQAPEPQPAEVQQTVVAQIDMLVVDRYWTDPEPLCPRHGSLQLDRAALTRAFRGGETSFAVGAP